MSSRQLLLVILLFTWLRVASGDSVVPTDVTRNDGEPATLLCLTKYRTNISDDIIQWYKGPKTPKNEPIHKYVPRDRPPQTQRPDFINLTSLSEEGLSSGDFSLSLTVNTSHNDTYYCYVAGRHCCTVTLKVLPKGKDSSGKHQDVTESPVNPPSGTDGQTTNYWTIGGVVGGVLGVVAALIGLGVCLYRKHLGCRGNANNPPINQGVPLQAQQPPQNEGNEPVDQNQNKEQN